MKTTFNQSFFLKVSKQELPIDGVSLGMYYVLRGDKLSHMYKTKLSQESDTDPFSV